MGGKGGEEVKLLGGWPSPFVMRARIALNLKSVGYEFLEEKFGVKSELLLQSNPVYKKIPVLLHGSNPICESLIIVEYIDDTWSSNGPSILPPNPYDRAVARFWAVYIDNKWFPSFMGMMRAKDEEEKKNATEQVISGLQLLEEAFEKCSNGKGFFGGDTIGYFDIALGCYLGWIRVAENLNTGEVKLLDPEKMPLLVGWAHRFCEADTVKDVMPDTDKLAEFAKMMMAKLRAQE